MAKQHELTELLDISITAQEIRQQLGVVIGTSVPLLPFLVPLGEITHPTGISAVSLYVEQITILKNYFSLPQGKYMIHYEI